MGLSGGDCFVVPLSGISFNYGDMAYPQAWSQSRGERASDRNGLATCHNIHPHRDWREPQ